MLEFIMLIGLPASGKTTYSDKYKSLGYNIHSSDEIRKEILNDENNQDNNTDVFKVLHKRVKEDIENGKSVVYDATNISWKRRRNFLLEIAKYSINKKCILFATEYSKCLSNDKSRSRTVSDDVISRMYRSFYIPHKFEGWDEIEIVWDYNSDNYDLKWKLCELMSFDQDTPHHTFTLGEHLVKTGDYLENHSMQNIGYLHDIGKPFCKSVKYDEKLDIMKSTYYDHHSVSAYESLFYLKELGYNENDILNMSTIINWHMQPYFMQLPKTHEKYKKIWGNELYNNVMMLHKADKSAH